MKSAGAALSARIEEYLFERLLPLWAEHGWDHARGGFYDQLEADHSPSPLPQRRLTVAGRLLFVFSEAARLTSLKRFRDVAHAAYDHLVRKFWDERYGGWFFTTDLAGAPLDVGKDLYGHAFAIFGLAHYYRAFRRKEALEQARQSIRLLKDRLLLPAGWFASGAARDWGAKSGALNQNPHMHLLEAYLALAAADENSELREDANAIVDLLHGRLFDEVSGTLGEFFDERGLPHPETGSQVEPGHFFEWYWLLREGASLWTDRRALETAERLFDWAERHGVDRAHGGVYDLLDRRGRVIKDSKRIWPQAERIKAHAARLHGTGDGEDRARLESLLAFLFESYLLADGGWRESLGRELAPQTTVLPGTTPYHIFLALTEALKALAP